MHFKFSYFLSYVSAAIAAISLFQTGWGAWLFVAYAFGLIPILELFFKGNAVNFSKEEEQVLKNRPIYDWLLYGIFYVQWALVFLMLYRVGSIAPSIDTLAYIFTLGITCGVFGINVAHELGHRVKGIAPFYAQGLLLTSLYMHFTIEHNLGHHTHVGTYKDGATARKNEWVFLFWLRSVWCCYSGAWKIENSRWYKKGKSPVNLGNKMIQITLIQLLWLGVIYMGFGEFVLGCFIASAVVGFLLLETVNYVEHYGLMRQLKPNGNPVPVVPVHSWNSNHPVGRGLLFELSRHSDHHFRASRKYQVLRSFEDSPIMPTGYPGMILMSLVPPLWFSMMNPRVETLIAAHPDLLR